MLSKKINPSEILKHMKKIPLLLLLFTMFFASPLKTMAQPFVQFNVQATDVDCQATSVSIDIEIVDFIQMNAFDYSFHWDPNALSLQPTGINDLNLISGMNISGAGSSTGTLTISWFSLELMGTTVPDGSIITLTFDVIGNASQDFNFTFDSNPTFLNIAQYGMILNDTQYSLGEGLLNITDSENPTLSGCPGNLTFDTGGGATSQITGAGVTAMDNCGVDSIGYVLSGDMTGSGNGDVSNNVNFVVGTTTVTYTAYDFDGNTSTVCQFDVEVTNWNI